jgi:hypothetical protein
MKHHLSTSLVKVTDASCVSQISVVLGRQEKDFLAAYRAHMYNVQKELHEMREKIRRNETVENKSEKIKKLEDERDWYRKEALRLDAFTTSMSKDLKAMRDKLEAIEGDRDWLEKQLKACKKQNKLLRAEIDSRLSAAVTLGMDGGAMPSFDATPNKLRASVASTTGSKRTSDVALGGTSTADGLPYLNLDGVAQSPTLVEEREEKLKKKLRQLKRELQQKTQEILVARQQRNATGGRDDGGGGARSRLESLFLQCVESVKEEVARRRSNPTEDKSAKSTLAAHRQPPRVLLPEAIARNQRRDEVDEFTSADRVRLIERLLAHNEVLTLLYAQLFPSENEPAPAAAAATSESTSPNAQYAISEDVDAHSRPTSPTLHSSESLANARMNADASEVLVQDGSSSQRALTPVGSGAAFASAARGSGLPLDSFTKDYLRAMYVQGVLAFIRRHLSDLTHALCCPGGRKRTRSADNMQVRKAR